MRHPLKIQIGSRFFLNHEPYLVASTGYDERTAQVLVNFIRLTDGTRWLNQSLPLESAMRVLSHDKHHHHLHLVWVTPF